MSNASWRTDQTSGLFRITTEALLNAFHGVQRAHAYDLAFEINERMPQGARGEFVPFSRAFSVTFEGTGRGGPFRYAAEAVIGTLHTSTHVDGLNHVCLDGQLFGGHDVAECRDDRGFSVHGMETVPPMIGRFVFLDIPAFKGLDELPDRYEITVGDLRGTLERLQGSLAPGDFVLVRTGRARHFYEGDDTYVANQPGVGVEAAIWLYEQGMAALGTDTAGTEPMPFLDPARTTHHAMLAERGVHLIENLNLEDLSADAVSSGLFICLPLKFTGATGSWVRPIAVI